MTGQHPRCRVRRRSVPGRYPWLPARCGRPCSTEKRLHRRCGWRCLSPFRPGLASRSMANSISSRCKVAPLAGRLSQQSTVKGWVPAARRREAPGEKAMRRLRQMWVRQVVGDIRMSGVQAAAGCPEIGLLGDGQRDDANARIGQRGQHRAGVFRRHQQRANRADDAQLLFAAAADRQRVEPILRRQRIACVGAAQGDSDNTPIRLARCQAVVDIGGLMGAMEGADAQMHDARGDLATIIAWDRDLLRQRP